MDAPLSTLLFEIFDIIVQVRRGRVGHVLGRMWVRSRQCAQRPDSGLLGDDTLWDVDGLHGCLH